MKRLSSEDKFHHLLLKLLLFSFVYGLVFINWIDLYTVPIPAYHLWLILMFFAPFYIIVIFEGLRYWELALAFAVSASLMNDLFYYVVGDLFFGFHVALPDWYLHQFGFYGTQVLFTFQAGLFTFGVESWMMGLSILTRVVIVALVLKHYWDRSP